MPTCFRPAIAGFIGATTFLMAGLAHGQDVDKTVAAAEAAKAKAALASYLKPPSELTVKTPLIAPPEAGRIFVWLNCDAPLCQVIGDGVKAATEAAGWKYEQINFVSGDPATLAAAFRLALEKNPVAVATSGIPPEAGWGMVIPEFRSAGVPIILSYIGGPDVGDEYADVVRASVASGKADRAFHGDVIANWFIADSGGTGHALLENIPAFPALDEYSKRLREVIKQNCTYCKTAVIDNTMDQAISNGIVPSLIPELQKNPDIGYALVSSLEWFDGLPSALSASNLNVKVGGITPSVTGYELLKQGKFSAATTLALEYSGWLQVDSALRIAAKMELDPGDEGPMPVQLLLPDSTFDIKPSFDPEGYQEAFRKLWKVK